jgi:hypothetical protein
VPGVVGGCRTDIEDHDVVGSGPESLVRVPAIRFVLEFGCEVSFGRFRLGNPTGDLG